MSYAVVYGKPFSGPEECSASEHWDAESSSCQAGLCPPGLVLDAGGNCNEPGVNAPAPEAPSSSGSATSSPSSSGGSSPYPYTADVGGGPSGGSGAAWLVGAGLLAAILFL